MTDAPSSGNRYSAGEVQDVAEDVTCPSGHGHEWLTIWGGDRADYVCHHAACQKMFYANGGWY